MDPIHPIVPQPPTLPPIAPAPATTRVDRDAGRQGAGPGGKRRKRSAAVPERPPGTSADSDPGPHIDITA